MLLYHYNIIKKDLDISSFCVNVMKLKSKEEYSMNQSLLTNLINSNVIRPGTELAILRYGIGLDGIKRVATNFIMVGTNESPERTKANHIVEVHKCYENEKGEILIEAYSTADGELFNVKPADIHLIDGMSPKKIAYVYGYNEDGSKRKLGKKRGRKPKIRE